MYIERKEYLDKLLRCRWNGQIKVITVVRRCGKSFLVFTIFRDYLLAAGVKSENIIAIALDNLTYGSRKTLWIHKKQDSKQNRRVLCAYR